MQAPRTQLIGRVAELEQIAAALDQDGACVTLTGAGGSGKTRLALEATGARTDAIWVEAAGVSDASSVLQRVATTTGVTAADIDELTRALTGRIGLLVLDNCEHLIEICAEVASAFLSAGWRVLATSREPLGIGREQVILIQPLSHPDTREAPAVETLARYDAVALFVQRAVSVQPDFTLTASNAPAIAQICRRLDGIPLALELAAARIAVLSPNQIAERLKDRFRLLTSPHRDAEPRRRTLQATIAWGYDLLEDRERALLTRASLFSGRFDLEALEQACSDDAVPLDDVLDVLTKLVLRSLVVVETGDRVSYRLLDSIREYANAHLEDADVWRARIITWAAGFGDAAKSGLSGSEQEDWAARLATLHDSLMGVLADARTLDPVAGLQICDRLWNAWNDRGANGEVARVLAEVLHAAKDAPPRLRMSAHLALGNMLANIGRFEDARRNADAALALEDQVDDESFLAKARNTVGNVRTLLGDSAGALDAYTRAMEIERRAPGPDLASIVANLAGLYQGLGERDRARDLYSEAADLFRAAGDRARLGMLTMNQGTLLHETGDPRGALECYTESLAIARAMGERRTQVILGLNMGNAHQDLGDTRTALLTYSETLAAAREIASPFVVAVVAQSICLIAAGYGDYEAMIGADATVLAAEATWRLRHDATGESPIHEVEVAARAILSERDIARIREAGRTRSLDDLAITALEIAERLIDGEAGSPTKEVAPGSGAFRRSGDVWEISFRSSLFRLRDSKGLAYIARLLAEPDHDIHVADLVGATGIADPEGVRRRSEAADDVIDPAAARAYAEKIRELETERDEAVSWSDSARAESISDQIDELSGHLSSSYGLAGRARRAADPAERMRKAVTNRIRDAISRIGSENPGLERYLRNSLRTGTFCSYRPASPTRWDL